MEASRNGTMAKWDLHTIDSRIKNESAIAAAVSWLGFRLVSAVLLGSP